MRPGEITVAVATCGRPEALARCLSGLACGSALPGEVLVVDQCPSDLSSAVVDQAGLPRVSYLRQPRFGLSASRNLALAHATLPAFAVTDDDCVPDAGWVSALAAALGRPPTPAAVTGSVLPLGEGGPGLYAVSLRESPIAVDYVGRIPPWVAGSGANFAASCELLRSYGGWDERLGTGSPGRAAEDADLLYRILRDGFVVRYEPRAIVRHEWQTYERRLATRWSYGFGVGALCGLWFRRGDPFASRMLLAYLRLHVRPLVSALARGDRDGGQEHARAVASLAPGLIQGLRAPQRQRLRS